MFWRYQVSTSMLALDPNGRDRFRSLSVSDFATLSRRGKGLKVALGRSKNKRPIALIMGSTGLKIHGNPGWHD